MADAYKYTHYKQYPPGIQNVYSYYESRGGRWPNTVFFGLQYFLKRYLVGQVITQQMIDEAEPSINAVFGHQYFSREGWEYIIDTYKGRLPVTIRAVEEGSINPTRTVLMNIVNNDTECYWLTNYLETLLSNLWYPCTVATESYQIKKLLQTYYTKANQQMNGIELNDFGMRGCSCPEQAAIGGMAHLTSFIGTDNILGIQAAKKYYNATQPIGVSVAAAEHSTITAWSREREADAYLNMIRVYPDDAILSLVCDSYDTENALENIFGWELYEWIMHHSGKVVMRPDSGDPCAMSMLTLEKLHNLFGAEKNKAGYNVLNPHVGVIYGDSIDYETIKKIMDNVVLAAKYAPSNIIFGSGGGLLQKLNRDTNQYAFKCSAVRVYDKWEDVCKTPITDPNKRSKAGRVGEDLPIVFDSGKLLRETTFDEIRKKLEVT